MTQAIHNNQLLTASANYDAIATSGAAMLQ
jgi:hypothetical protein